MLKKISFILLFAILGLSFSFQTNFAQNKKKKKEVDPQVIFSLNENHDLLNKFQGTWKYNFIITSTEDGLAGVGTTSNTIINDGRHIQFNQEMNVSGVPTKITQFMGYDNISKKFYLFSIDNSRTDAMISYGDYDSTKKQLVFYGNELDYDGVTQHKYKIVYTFDRDNKYTYQFFGIEGENESQKMIMVYIKL